MIDNSGSLNIWSFYVGHGAANPPSIDYPPNPNIYEVPIGPGDGGVSFSLVVDLFSAIGFTAPVGVPIRFAVPDLE